jgi:hypothetical protein
VVGEHAGEGFGHWDWFGAKANPDFVWGHDDRGCGEGGDPGDGGAIDSSVAIRHSQLDIMWLIGT